MRIRIADGGKSKFHQYITNPFVRNAIENMAHGQISTFSFSTKQAPYTYYNGEGYQTRMVCDDGRSRHVETVSEETVGGFGLCHDVNGSVECPAGIWIIEIRYYCGYIMTVTRVTDIMIDRCASV